MKILVYNPCSLLNPQLGIQLDEAISQASVEGNEVAFVYCNGTMKICSANIYGARSICRLCRKTSILTLSKVISKIKLIPLNDRSCQNVQPFSYNTIDELKEVKYKNVNVGYSVFSYYVSKTRNPNPILDREFTDNMSVLLRQAVSLTDSLLEVLDFYKPDKLILFNGRFFETKPALDLAVSNNMEYQCNENIDGIRVSKKYKVVNFLNSTPHSSVVFKERMLKSWDISKFEEKEKRKKGSEFYENRINGKISGDVVYTENQVLDCLPANLDLSIKNIVIFCSSEDEMVSINKESDRLKLFKSQYEGVKNIMEMMRNDNSYHFYLRIHPNLVNLDFPYHKDFYKLSIYSNITIIPADSKVSSYSLLNLAHQVIVFGSTIGIEAVYANKPVILLSDAAYYYFDICCIPTNLKELKDAIYNPRIITEDDRLMAIKYGYYIMDNNLAFYAKNIDITPISKKLGNKKFYYFKYLKLLRSSLLYKSYQSFITMFVSKFDKKLISYQDKILK